MEKTKKTFDDTKDKITSTIKDIDENVIKGDKNIAEKLDHIVENYVSIDDMIKISKMNSKKESIF